MQILSIIISCVALIFSGYTVWTNAMSSFNIKVEVSSPLLAMAGIKKGSDLVSVSMLVTMDMINTGARGGSIKDILIRLDTESNEYPTWFFHPYYFSEEYSIKALGENMREVMHPIYIKGKERTNKNIIFTPISDGDFRPPIFPVSNPKLPAGKYIMTFFILDSTNADFRRVQQISFNLVLDQVSVVTGNFPFVPRTSDTREARDRFFKSNTKTEK